MPPCPDKVATQVTVEPSGEKRHNFAVLSKVPVAKRGAVEWNATEKTMLRIGRVVTQVTADPSGEKRQNFVV